MAFSQVHTTKKRKCFNQYSEQHYHIEQYSLVADFYIKNTVESLAALDKSGLVVPATIINLPVRD